MEMSGRCNKKRKICHQEDEEDDEEKMEKFFAIISSIREARDHFMLMGAGAANGVAEQGRSNASKKSKPDDAGPDLSHHQEERKRPVEVWKPSFVREDFMGEADKLRMMTIKNPPAASMAASGTRQGGDDRKKGVGEEDLDLKLSL